MRFTKEYICASLTLNYDVEYILISIFSLCLIKFVSSISNLKFCQFVHIVGSYFMSYDISINFISLT